jgi:hypothetical protein
MGQKERNEHIGRNWYLGFLTDLFPKERRPRVNVASGCEGNELVLNGTVRKAKRSGLKGATSPKLVAGAPRVVLACRFTPTTVRAVSYLMCVTPSQR